jgi:hypothetical protein
MFNKQTVFVLGAGSSEEVGFPLGKALAQTIGRKLDIKFEHGFQPLGDADFDLFGQLVQTRQNERQQFQQAGWLIRDGVGLVQSIDDFLDLHRSNALANQYGKAAIVKTILEAERASKLYFSPFEGAQFNTAKFADSWFVKFMYMLGRRIPREAVQTIFDHVSFIIFNYDRCVEFFLLNALQQLYRISDTEAKSILSTLRIVHPYGTVPANIPFVHTNVNCAALTNSIKTYTEQIADTVILEKVIDELEQAEHIVFLGSAYHDQNMALLRHSTDDLSPSKRIFGTAYGMSQSDVDIVGLQIDAWFTGHNPSVYRTDMIRLENGLKCAGLFDNYAKSLTG